MHEVQLVVVEDHVGPLHQVSRDLELRIVRLGSTFCLRLGLGRLLLDFLLHTSDMRDHGRPCFLPDLWLRSGDRSHNFRERLCIFVTDERVGRIVISLLSRVLWSLAGTRLLVLPVIGRSVFRLAAYVAHTVKFCIDFEIDLLNL